MALLSDLVRTVAAAEGLDEGSVAQFARAAREAGLIAQSGRGPSAARMGVEDARNLILAVNTSALAKDVEASVKHFRDLRASEGWTLFDFFDAFTKREPGAKLGEAIDYLIRSCWPGDDGLIPLQAALAARAKRRRRSAAERLADRRGIKPVPPWIEIEFRRPARTAEIRLRLPIVSTSGGTAHVHYVASANLRFGRETLGGGFALAGPDRADTTVISHRTLMAVADILAT